MINNKKIIFISLILLSLIFVAGCVKKSSLAPVNNNIAVNSNVQPGEVAILDSDIIVNKPLSYDKITSPVKVQGRAASSLNKINIWLLDALENQIASTTVTVAADESLFDFFSVDLGFEHPNTPQGWLEVFSISEDNNSVQNLIKLPVLFNEYKQPVVKVYYSNIKEDPDVKNCDQVYPVTREVSFDKNPIAAALEQLLVGLTEQEMKEGFFDNLPEGVKVQKIELNDGILSVDFNQALQEGVAGSCRVTAIRAQVVETLKQFDNVKDIIISIDGESETILQP